MLEGVGKNGDTYFGSIATPLPCNSPSSLIDFHLISADVINKLILACIGIKLN